MSGADDSTGGAPRTDHWPRHAQQWARVGAPLRPSPEDVACVEGIAGARARPLRGLVLGVTPELVGMRWPAGSAVIAVDRSAAMIAAMPRAGADASASMRATALQADWRALPCAAGSIDLAAGDGSLSCLPFPRDYRVLAGELARALAPGGELVLRLFASPEPRETLADVAAAVAARAIGGFHAFKWRLAMAIAGGGDVAVADIARAFDRVAPDPDALAAHTGWPRVAIATIDAYRGSDVVYSFPSAADAVAALAPELALVAQHVPAYELGERCPTVVLRRGV
jgi:SAM-dependent methyltransferase